MEENQGAVTIAPQVLLALIRLTVLATPGVAHLSAENPRGVQRLFGGKSSEGIRLEIEDQTVSIDLYVVAEPDAKMLPLGQALQREVSRAIQDVVGMPVREVNVNIDDVANRRAVES